MIVRHVSLRDFRSYATLELELEPGLVLVTGPNGVGKTNLLEALHVGSQGFSPRTRAETRLVRFGERGARVRLRGAAGGSPFETEIALAQREPKRVRLNGAALAAADDLRERLTALAFTPDRLAVVKGGPIVRRAYFDRMIGRLFPARGALAGEYGRALAQRNVALRRVRAGISSLDAVAPWTDRVVELGAELDSARAMLIALLASGFGARAAELGLEAATLSYEPSGISPDALRDRLDRDVERGTTGLGPHLADFAVRAGERELRAFGSQGEQRTAVLALVLTEGAVLLDQRGDSPLLLLDDVFSELDERRRDALLAALPEGAQTIVTATERAVMRGREALVVEVRPGEARRA